MNFIGIDLAWKISDSPKRRTGVAAIDNDGRLIDIGIAATDDEILAFVAEHMNGLCAIGIDAPLVVPNETGQRPVEWSLLKQGMPAYPANRTLFDRVHGGIRGELLVEKLNDFGFELAIEYSRECRRPMFEVFPSPAYRALLGLDSTIKLKQRKGVRAADIQDGLGIARDRLFSGILDPPLVVDESILSHPFIDQGIEELRGTALSQFGDMLDAVVSAYIVYLYCHRPKSIHAIGDIESGYVIVPKQRSFG